ncbi:hypothetical protein [Ancylomarina longa]|uniref:Uncharacterized protein n=1 Tax=Ancylomarina longa TaxID=2487017 RepID=A0A434AGN2_9BACT|nr:hypothetical protein [Ancylomarina longa]RUT73565.1 hypothetical protein DLK05_12730 [Ancylomarina longa]
MREICISIPFSKESQITEIEIKIGGESKASVFYRLESFDWEVLELSEYLEDDLSKKLGRIDKLKSAIASYDKNWEVIQIFTPPETAEVIQVLYRKKNF